MSSTVRFRKEHGDYVQSAEKHVRANGGAMIGPASPSWSAWKTYFEFRGLRECLARMKHLEVVGAGCRYMVPAEWPIGFDASSPAVAPAARAFAEPENSL